MNRKELAPRIRSTFWEGVVLGAWFVLQSLYFAWVGHWVLALVCWGCGVFVLYRTYHLSRLWHHPAKMVKELMLLRIKNEGLDPKDFEMKSIGTGLFMITCKSSRKTMVYKWDGDKWVENR